MFAKDGQFVVGKDMDLQKRSRTKIITPILNVTAVKPCHQEQGAFHGMR